MKMDQTELFHPRPAAAELVLDALQNQQEDDVPFVFEDTEQVRVAYTVRLVDYAAVDEALRSAEQRFRRELDRQLGADVVPALRAFQNASESGEIDLTKTEIALATRWAKAYDAARTAGFRDMGDTQEAYFEVRPI